MIIKLNSIYKSKIIFKKKVFFCQVGKGGIVPKYLKKKEIKKLLLVDIRLIKYL